MNRKHLFSARSHCWLLGIVPGVLFAQSEDVTNRLRACAQINDQASRLACYDKLGQESRTAGTEVAGAPAGDEVPAAPAAATPRDTPSAAVPTSAPTNVPYKGDRPTEEYRVVVTSCQRNRNKDLYLTFDNGEVWKQTGGKNIGEDDCNFSATLRKDLFGYKMTIDGVKGGVRVKRIK